MKIKPGLVSLLVFSFSITAFAEQNPSQGQGGPNGPNGHSGPPRQAMEACVGKAKDDACSFTGPGGKSHDGVCFNGPDGKGMLACLPKPPKEAVDACSGKNEGDSCSFTGMNNNEIKGGCFKTPSGEVACRPSKMPRAQGGDSPL